MVTTTLIKFSEYVFQLYSGESCFLEMQHK
jgi:hypothetical protein